MDSVKQWADRMKSEIGKVILGKDDVIEKILTAILCGGHVLLEDVPGVGKTILARSLAAAMEGKYQRIQGTPDLMPSDILGVSVFIPEAKQFRFFPGPIHSNIVLIDEINRATPRSQSALFEAMENRAITLEGKRIDLPDPFFLIATENPLDFEGTFPLPDAQKDRFFLSTSLGYPSKEMELILMSRQNTLGHPVDDLVPVSNVSEILALRGEIEKVSLKEETEEVILNLVRLSREDPSLEMGASPRATRALHRGCLALAAIRGEKEATLKELTELAFPILNKRLKLKREAILNGETEGSLINSLLEKAILTRENT